MPDNNQPAPRCLFKSRKDKMLDGVCGGVAEFFHVDPTIIRVAWFAACFLSGLGFWAYIIAAIVMPSNPEHKNLSEEDKKSHSPRIVWGIILIIFGALFLFKGFHFPFCWSYPHLWFNWWDFSWEFIGPFVLIALGIAYIMHVLHQEKAEYRNHETISQSTDTSAGRIYRPLNERMIAGVCSSIARHWKIDPTWVRIACASIAILTQIAPMVILYIVLIIVIPKSPDSELQ